MPDPSTPLLFFAVDTVRCLSTPASSLLLWFLCKPSNKASTVFSFFFYVIFQPHTFSDSLKFWTTTPPSPLLVHLLSTFLSSFFAFIHKRPPAISIPAHTIFFAPVTPPSVTEFARSVCFSVSSVSGCGYHSSSAWLCHILRVCHSIILSASSVCLSFLFFSLSSLSVYPTFNLQSVLPSYTFTFPLLAFLFPL